MGKGGAREGAGAIVIVLLRELGCWNSQIEWNIETLLLVGIETSLSLDHVNLSKWRVPVPPTRHRPHPIESSTPP